MTKYLQHIWQVTVIISPNALLLIPLFGFYPSDFISQISPNIQFAFSHSPYPYVAAPSRVCHIATQIEICVLERFLFSL